MKILHYQQQMFHLNNKIQRIQQQMKEQLANGFRDVLLRQRRIQMIERIQIDHQIKDFQVEIMIQENKVFSSLLFPFDSIRFDLIDFV